MRELIADIVAVDWEQVRLRRAAGGLVSMLLVLAFLDALGDPVLATLLAALFTTASGGDGPMSQRLPGMIRFTVIGAAIGGLAWWSIESPAVVAVTLGAATYLGTLAAAEGPAAARAGLFLTIWPLFALMLGSQGTNPWTVVVGFLAGGAIAIAVTAIRLRVSGEDAADDSAEVDLLRSDQDSEWSKRVLSAVRSPIGLFAIVRSVAVILAVIVGFAWFSSYPLWVAITVIVVVRPSANQSVSTAVQRTLGTAAGVVAATAVAQILPRNDIAVAVAFLVCGLLMVAFNNANYTLFAAALTAMLVFGQRLAHEDAFEAGWQRLLATVVGVVVSLAVMYVGAAIIKRPGTTIGNR